MRMPTTPILAFVIALGMAIGATPANAFFFDYEEPTLRDGGDCAAIAAQIGPEATWYGDFAGNRYDEFTNYRTAVSARGCFPSEYACRVWQNSAITYLGRGGIVYMRCTPGVPGRY